MMGKNLRGMDPSLKITILEHEASVWDKMDFTR